MYLKKYCLIFATLVLSSAFPQRGWAQHLEKEIPLPNVQGRIDHFSIDPSGQRLFVSALGNRTVEVINLKRGERTASIANLKEPQGVAYDPDAKRLFVASDGDGTVRSYDGNSFAPLNTANLGDDADNIRYDSQAKHVIVGYGDGGLASFDTNLKTLSDVKLPVHPESFQLERDGSHVFVNLPDDSSIGVIDRKTNEVKKWHITAAGANFPMALDERNKRLFVGCRNPAKLLVFDTDSGKLIAELPAAGDTDDLFYDATRKRIYLIGGAGYLDVFTQKDVNQYELITRIKTSPGARTGLFAPTLNRLFIAAPRRGSNAAKILVYQID